MRSLYEIINNGKNLFMIFEYCDSDLQKFIKYSQGDIPIAQIQSILKQLIRALSFCHSHRTFHRDIKPGNVFMNNDGTVKLGDFGLARAIRSTSKHFTPEVISLWYRAPEILLKMPSYTTAVDMWSVGVIFGEMIIKRQIFCGSTEEEQLIKIFELLGIPDDQSWPGISKYPHPEVVEPSETTVNEMFHRVGDLGLSLLKSLLVMNPDKRITADRALNHPFLS